MDKYKDIASQEFSAKVVVWCVILTLLILIIGLLAGEIKIVRLSVGQPESPREILCFAPIYKGSDPNDIRIAQAELCRHEIDVKIDGDCGKQTALGICELLVKIENGYEIKSIYDKRLSK